MFILRNNSDEIRNLWEKFNDYISFELGEQVYLKKAVFLTYTSNGFDICCDVPINIKFLKLICICQNILFNTTVCKIVTRYVQMTNINEYLGTHKRWLVLSFIGFDCIALAESFHFDDFYIFSKKLLLPWSTNSQWVEIPKK